MDRIDVIVPNDKDFGFYPMWKSRNNDIKSFFENYSKTTKKLGEKAQGSQWNLDDETKKIMRRIRLPSFAESIPVDIGELLASNHYEHPTEVEKNVNEAASEWDKDNFFYKIRAAQALKNVPEEVRENMLDHFKIDYIQAKRDMDNLIVNQEVTAKMQRKGLEDLRNGIGDFITKFRDAIANNNQERK